MYGTRLNRLEIKFVSSGSINIHKAHIETLIQLASKYITGKISNIYNNVIPVSRPRPGVPLSSLRPKVLLYNTCLAIA